MVGFAPALPAVTTVPSLTAFSKEGQVERRSPSGTSPAASKKAKEESSEGRAVLAAPPLRRRSK